MPGPGRANVSESKGSFFLRAHAAGDALPVIVLQAEGATKPSHVSLQTDISTL